MRKQTYTVLGGMSGTSLDGLDLVLVRLEYQGNWKFEILASECIPYDKAWRRRLHQGIELNTKELNQLDIDYTELLGDLYCNFLDKHPQHEILAICSHGHTISHDPKNGHTYQIGNLPRLANKTGQRVVCDFRVQDVELGGQGAPLVPIGDRLLFGEYEYCLNLGGFANLSYESNEGRIAYDIVPVNVVLNHYAQLLNKEYDENGAFAKAGTPQTSILHKLAQLPFYKEEAPKSLGIEWVSNYIFPILSSITDPKDALATYTHHVAEMLKASLPSEKKILVTGGGAFNLYLMELLRESGRNIHIPSPSLVNYKEAVVFALLGVLRLRNQNNCLASVTGASRDHCSGKIYTA